MAVYFRCPSCGGNHKSPIQFDKKSFEDPTNIIKNSAVNCPTNRVMVTINKEDMFWKEE